MTEIIFQFCEPAIIKIKKCINKSKFKSLINANIFQQHHNYAIAINIDDSILFHEMMISNQIEVAIDINSLCAAIKNTDDDIIIYFINNMLLGDEYEDLIRAAMKIKALAIINILLDKIFPDDLVHILRDEYMNMDNLMLKKFLKKIIQSEYYIYYGWGKLVLAELLSQIIKNNDHNTIKIFQKCGIDINNFKERLIRTALDKGLENILESLFDCVYCDISEINYEKYLLKYILTDQIEIIELIFRMHEFDYYWLNQTFMTLGKSSCDVVQIFIDNGVDIDQCGLKLISLAKKYKNTDLVQYLKQFV